MEEDCEVTNFQVTPKHYCWSHKRETVGVMKDNIGRCAVRRLHVRSPVSLLREESGVHS